MLEHGTQRVKFSIFQSLQFVKFAKSIKIQLVFFKFELWGRLQIRKKNP